MNHKTNAVHVEGYVFSHNLRALVSKKTGTPFIMGDLNIATDDTFTNVVPVHFTYVTETFKSGKANPTWEILQELMAGGKTVESDGTDAMKVRIDGDVEVNDFVTRDGDMASPKRVRGSFMHLMTGPLSDMPATFDVDMLIVAATEREVEDGDDYLNLRGYVFNYREDALPIDVNVRSKGGMNYFEDCDISSSNPLYTHIKGEIVSQSIVREVTEESAFGEPIVRKVTRNLRTWDVTWASVEPYEWDDESTLTKKEFKKKLAEREEHLAQVKKDYEEYQASRDGGQSFASKPAATVTTAVEDDDDNEFDF